MAALLPAAIVIGIFIAASSGSKKKATGYKPPPGLPPGAVPVSDPPVSTKVNQWGLIGCDPMHTPSGKSSPAVYPGFATHPDYQWCYVVKEGDSAGGITEMFFNSKDGWRYAELLAANPQKLTSGTTISPSDSADTLDFTSLEEGETIYLPRTWNPFIDQTGKPKTKVM